MSPRLLSLRPRAARRAFTLVELMVAITGGLFMSLVVFALARDGSRFYQRETRVADATLSSVAGLERLRGDLLRAGFMASPNVGRDPSLCQNLGTLQGMIREMTSVVVDRPDPASGSDADQNDLVPDRLTLAGNFTSFDQFPILGVREVNNTYVIDLQARLGPLARAGYVGSTTAAQAAYLAGQFPAGRLLRIVSGTGRTQYGVIQSVTGGADPQITLSQNFAVLTFTNTASCGLREIETSAAVNVVNFIRYELKNLSADAAYAVIYGDANPYDAGRTELVRSELDPSNGAVFAGTEEIVAEYTVNLSVGLTVVNTVAGQNVTELRTIEFGNDDVLAFASDSTHSEATKGPERIRNVRVRLSVRSREPDRDSDVVTGGAVAPGLYRIAIGDPDAGARPFARVRTLQADIALHNQVGLQW